MPTEQLKRLFYKKTHCSVLVKLDQSANDVFFGHTTWDTFADMTRVFKEYHYTSENGEEYNVAFSSYPGCLNSVDDFYVTSHDLAVTETTNNVYNTDLYDLLKAETILTWQRTMIANKLARTGKQWTHIFAKFNSGTYNNQYMILDMKKINKKKPLNFRKNTLWIIEQAPGYTEAADVSHVLFKQGYWASYNVPYFDNMFKLLAYDVILKQDVTQVSWLDYKMCVRAQMFARDNHKVTTMDSFKALIRYNDYEVDPLSRGDPEFSIASRMDLDKVKPDCFGATDAKLIQVSQFKEKKSISIISGPTADQQPAFNVNNATCISVQGNYQFVGMPEVYKFDWVDYEAKMFR